MLHFPLYLNKWLFIISTATNVFVVTKWGNTGRDLRGSVLTHAVVTLKRNVAPPGESTCTNVSKWLIILQFQIVFSRNKNPQSLYRFTLNSASNYPEIILFCLTNSYSFFFITKWILVNHRVENAPKMHDVSGENVNVNVVTMVTASIPAKVRTALFYILLTNTLTQP